MMAKNAVFHAKTKLIPIHDGEELIVLINETDAWENGISAMDKVVLNYKGKDLVLNADLTTKYVKPGEIGLYEDIVDKYEIPVETPVSVHFTQTDSKAMEALKKAIKG